MNTIIGHLLKGVALYLFAHFHKQENAEKVEPKKPTWEMKDRVYNLKGYKKPLSYMLKSSNVYYFDEEKGYERELKYTTNQTTAFVDEFKGVAKLEHITFEDGTLTVPKRKQTLHSSKKKNNRVRAVCTANRVQHRASSARWRKR